VSQVDCLKFGVAMMYETQRFIDLITKASDSAFDLI
jgi:hypothetical protein